MKKRFLSMLLAVLLLVGTLPLAASAAEVTVKEVVPCIYNDAGFFLRGPCASGNDRQIWLHRQNRERGHPLQI